MKRTKLSADGARMEADLLLADIRIGKRRLAELHADAAGEVRQIEARYAPDIALAANHIAEREKALERLVKRHRAEILGDGDRADLPRGSVMIKAELRVNRIKGMIERLRSAGLAAAIRVIKEAVDWDAVEKFDDATLAALGTERKTVDRFQYELKGADNG